MHNEIVIYQSEILTSHIEVRVEDETVWLSQLQMVDLFQSTKQNINLHINNVFKEGELDEISTVKEYLTVRQEGHRIVKRKVKLYSLDVIISVGYRVKSKTGTQFRIWATNTLKTYLLKGYVVQDRIERIEKRLYEHDTKIKLLLNTNLSPNQGIFYDGQVFDAYEFASKIIKSAKKSIIVIDNYIDESVLMLLSKRESKVKATVYTDKITATELAINGNGFFSGTVKLNNLAGTGTRIVVADATGNLTTDATNYIKNQNLSAQSANMWINGNITAKQLTVGQGFGVNLNSEW